MHKKVSIFYKSKVNGYKGNSTEIFVLSDNIPSEGSRNHSLWVPVYLTIVNILFLWCTKTGKCRWLSNFKKYHHEKGSRNYRTNFLYSGGSSPFHECLWFVFSCYIVAHVHDVCQYETYGCTPIDFTTPWIYPFKFHQRKFPAHER